MKKQRLLLAALIFSVSGWVSASVPIIKLVESEKAAVNFYSLLALNSYFFGNKNSNKPAGTNADNGMRDLQSAPVSPRALGVFSGLLTRVGNVSTLTNHLVGAGSFSSYASKALSPSSTLAPVSDVGPRSVELPGNVMVASPPAPKVWTVLLLALGCVIYQGRRRQRPRFLEK